MNGSVPAAVLKVEGLRIALPRGSDRDLAVDDVSFAIDAGRTLCIVGESGSGKSVLAMTLMGLQARELSVRAGQAHFVSTNADAPIDLVHTDPATLRSLRGRSMGMVFQEPMTALNPVMTCAAQLDELLCQHTRWSAKERSQAVLDIFERVRLPEPQRIMRSFPHQLSGGQRQRVVIAMAMLLKPRLLICDEPTTALDVTTQREVLGLIADMQREQGSAVLFITHDMSVVGEIADDVLVMHQGRAVEWGPCNQVLRAPRADYTRMLLAAVPSSTPPAPRMLEASAPVQLRAERLTKHYVSRSTLGKRRMTEALVDAELAVHQGETVGIVGESGCGKSTLARCMVRLIDPTSGKLYWGDQELANQPEHRLRPLRHRVQVVFQDPNRSLDPRQTVGAAIMEGARNFGVSATEAAQRAKRLLERVALSASAFDRYPNQFSGGQRQRIAIARALACQPLALVADEAVSALDVSVQAQILALLRDVQREFSLALVFITHDLRVAAQLCDRVIVMQKGRIVEQGATSVLFASPQHAYTQALFAAAPKGL